MDAVVVVDMLRGFLEDGHSLYCGASARAIIPNCQKLLELEKARGSTIIFLQDSHKPDDLEFRMFPPHCLEGTVEQEIIPELRAFGGVVVPKRRYSGFYGTNLESLLLEARPERLVICGVCTDICVMHSVADARNRDYPVIVVKDCVASFDDRAHAFALEHMERILGARLVALVDMA